MRALGVQVGKALPLRIGDEQVLSGIRKHAVAGTVSVRTLGLDGDEQADLTVHGGRAKAIYAYPVEHYPYWREQRRTLGLPDDLPHGSLGENLTIEGLLEQSLYVGDLLRFPDCLLRVTQPRTPCFKFVATMSDRQAARKMVRTGFSGFYLAVDEVGSIAAGQDFELEPGPRQTPLVALLATARSST